MNSNQYVLSVLYNSSTLRCITLNDFHDADWLDLDLTVFTHIYFNIASCGKTIYYSSTHQTIKKQSNIPANIFLDFILPLETLLN